MKDKSLLFYDGIDTADKMQRRTFNTSIDVINSETGEYIFKGLKNKVIIPGSGFIARKLFDIEGSEITPSYNDAISTMYTPEGNTAPDDEDFGDSAITAASSTDHRILLFCCGTDGCGTQNSQVYPVDYKKWIAPESLVPFRFVSENSDISDDLRDSYFGRSEETKSGSNYIAYYFKRFEEEPLLVQQLIDGTTISGSTYESSDNTAAESYVELHLKITKDDVREYFSATTGINNARINTVSLCSAYPVVEDGYIYFKDIRPVTKLNFPNEQFIDASKGIDIIYHIYM